MKFERRRRTEYYSANPSIIFLIVAESGSSPFLQIQNICSASMILLRIDEAIEKIKNRTARIHTRDYFGSTPQAIERLDSIAMHPEDIEK